MKKYLLAVLATTIVFYCNSALAKPIPPKSSVSTSTTACGTPPDLSGWTYLSEGMVWGDPEYTYCLLQKRWECEGEPDYVEVLGTFYTQDGICEGGGYGIIVSPFDWNEE